MHAAVTAALALGGMPIHAQPAREPLIITPLPEQELKVVALSDPEPDPAQEALRRFSAALDKAAAADRQAIEGQCRSAEAVPAAGPARLAWEANCRYRRR